MNANIEHTDEQSLIYGETEIRYRLRRSAPDSKKLRITVRPEGQVFVTAGGGLTEEEIRRELLRRARWIEETQQRFAAQRQYALPRRYVSGETHFYLGRRHELRIVGEENGTEVKLLRGKLEVPSRHPWSGDTDVAAARADEVRGRLWKWYLAHAETIFRQRFAALAPSVPWLKGQEISAPRLLTMKRRWGSCSPQGEILLNPHLVKTPRHCIDYVILHELCHLREHNHSPRFWHLMTQVCPDWRGHKAELDTMAEIWIGSD